MTETPFPRPEARYGRSRLSRASRRRLVIGLAVLVVAAGVVVAVIGYQRLGTSDVAGSLAGYQVIDNETASVTISVTRSDPSRPVDCIVRVRAKDGSETGRREVLVPPSDAGHGAGDDDGEVLPAAGDGRHLRLRHRRARLPATVLTHDKGRAVNIESSTVCAVVTWMNARFLLGP